MLASIFQNDMLIQADEPFRVWGKFAKNSDVEVVVSGITRQAAVTCCDENGNFVVEFNAIAPSFNKFSLTLNAATQNGEAGETVAATQNGEAGKTVSSTKKVEAERAVTSTQKKNWENIQTIENVVFGQLFLCEGQSNMELKVGYMDVDKTIAGNSQNENIRLLQIGDHLPSARGPAFTDRLFEAQDDLLEGKWKEASPSVVEKFSAIGYIFGNEMFKFRNCPIGIVDTSVGGLNIYSYLPISYQDKEPRVKEFLKKQKLYATKENYNTFEGMNFSACGGIYNEKISPLKNVNFKAILWYQGETEVLSYDGIDCYALGLKLLSQSIKETFKNAPPIFIFEIAPMRYSKTCAASRLNGIIARHCDSFSEFTLVPIYDVFAKYLVENGSLEFHPLHPIVKQVPAIRAAKMVERNLFGKSKMCSPSFKNVEYNNNTAEVFFNGDALKVNGDYILGFYGFDGADTFPLDAVLAGKNHVHVEGSKKLCGVGYAFFLYNTICNLCSTEGIPVTPFQTFDYGVEYFPFVPFCRGAKEAPFDCFWPEYGGVGQKTTWKNGEMFTSGLAKVDFVNSCPRLNFVRDNAAYFFNGISPEMNLNASDPHLEKSEEMEVTLDAAIEKLEFYGFSIVSSEGEFLHCNPKNALEGKPYLVLNKGENIVSIPFSPIDCVGSPISRDKLKGAKDIQFTFRAFEKGSVTIKRVVLK